MNACEMTSNSDPVAISTNRLKSVCDILDVPSAMFEDIETAARLI